MHKLCHFVRFATRGRDLRGEDRRESVWSRLEVRGGEHGLPPRMGSPLESPGGFFEPIRWVGVQCLGFCARPRQKELPLFGSPRPVLRRGPLSEDLGERIGFEGMLSQRWATWTRDLRGVDRWECCQQSRHCQALALTRKTGCSVLSQHKARVCSGVFDEEAGEMAA